MVEGQTNSLQDLQKLEMWHNTGSVKMKMQHYAKRIIVDPKVLAGKPIIKGTRIPVELVLKRLSQDLNMQTIFEAYPHLTEEDVKACFAYAEAVIEGETVYPIETDTQGSAQANI
jgi:uncharacterized protein (DUF433 family)